jgi:Flp pilus assembly protein TadG
MSCNRSRRTHISNQKGSVLLTFAVSIVGLFCFAVVAIDGAIMMTTKNQLQCAADAAALAGASAMTQGDTEVRRRAEYFAENNYAVQDTMRACLIDPDVDVVIHRDADENWVQVTTHRTTETGDPLRTYFLKILDLAAGLAPTRANTVDVTARAKAELVDNCGAACIKPWAIPDRWHDEDLDGIYEPGDGDFYDPIATGYMAPGDVGFQITLKQGNPNGSGVPGQYYPVDFPPVNKGNPLTGADIYEQWIATCCPFIISPGDTCLTETGMKQGPTIQGVQDLMSQDPDAYWDGTKVVSDKGMSPRIALVPFFDPRFPPTPGKSEIYISKIGAFFIESVGPGSTVTGRFIQVTAPGEPCDNNTGNSFVLGLHLIE